MSNLRQAASQAVIAMDRVRWAVAESVIDKRMRAYDVALEQLRLAITAGPPAGTWNCVCGATLYLEDDGTPRSRA